MTTEPAAEERRRAAQRRDRSLTLWLLLGSALLAGILYGGSVILLVASMDRAVMDAVPYPIMVAMLVAGGCGVGVLAALVARLARRRMLPLAIVGWLIGVVAVAVVLWQRGML
ncbi:hypothetical protein [Pseudactinotalea sp.]|uniref:hypothetical protein n=1 Tax=Pseudactinotalea sp. TaxID=1926260 RepID=UPI003B3B74DC